jgi:hypothetical protein
MISYVTREHMDSPSDLIQGNVIQAGYDIFFHLLHGCRTIHGSELLRADNLVSCVVIPNELRLELRV